ncbi:MAG: DUF2339 domain-containing protein [Sphingobium sp.]
MTMLLLLAVIVLWVIVANTRKRLAMLEDQVRRNAIEASGIDASIAAPAESATPAPASSLRTARVVRSSEPIEMAPASDEPATDEVAMREEDSERPAPDLPPAAFIDDEMEKASSVSTSSAFSFEDIFGRKLPIWAGGITLAVATVLLVKYSIDVGLLSPLVRIAIGLLFGAGLIGAAEWIRRKEYLVDDTRIPQALAGAGIASLYASILAAHSLYHFIGGGVAFTGLAAVTAFALALSLRFGAPSAVLGLVGGLAAPALVGATDPNIPLLCGYLALAIGGLTAVSRRQRWVWLGVGALLGGIGWTALMMLTGTLGHADTLAVGLLILMLAAVLPALAFGGEDAVAPRAVASLVGAAQMAALVATGGFELLHWGLYGLLSAAILWLARRNAALRRLPVIGLAVALMLAAAWPLPPAYDYTLVMLVLGALFAAPALWDLRSGEDHMMAAGQLIAIALGGYLITLFHFHHGPSHDGFFALLALACSVLPVAGAAFCWHHQRPDAARSLTVLSASAAILVVFTGYFGLPEQWWGIAAALAILPVAEACRQTRRDTLLPAAGVFVAAAALCALEPMMRWTAGALLSLGGVPLYLNALPLPESAATKLAIPAAIAAGSFWRLWPSLAKGVRIAAAAVLTTLAVAATHIFYRQLFAIDGHQEFVASGLAERTTWEAMLLAAGYALWRQTRWTYAALALVTAGAAHALWYSVILHNPLATAQAVGPAPLANLLLGAYGIPFAALWLAERIVPDQMARVARPADIVRMGLVFLFASATLRQLFSGSVLTTAPVSDFENILRSVLAIGLAIGFLLWGIWQKKHDWRIASLLLMLGAVAKVFLFDISGLTGLLRIASFLALGFSLIGIGWLYSRFLRKEEPS